MHALLSLSLYRSLVACVALLFVAPAYAVYKCESKGATLYSDKPCPGGKKVDLENKISIAHPDAAQEKKQIETEKAEAARLTRDRHKREATEDRQARIDAQHAAVHRAKCTTLAQRKQWSAEDAAGTGGRSAGKAERKARRAAEQYETQCGK